MLQTGRNAKLFGLFMVLSSQAIVSTSFAQSNSTNHSHYRHANFTRHHAASGGHVIQCVAFAKQDAGIVLPGNARDWWANASGVYQRGQAPEQGSVLSFTANGRMPLGHVAVVSAVLDGRTITIDQAHWNSAGVARDIEVKDVSENNDWSAVRVQLGHGGAFGSIYPTHGFIYARPDSGTIVEASARAPMPSLDRAPADLRTSGRHSLTPSSIEVAEMPATTRGLDLTVQGIGTDAPDRAFQ
jgi:surface antigen